MDDKLLTLDELAKYLNISRRTLYRLLQDGTLPGFRVGSHLRFKREEINQWLEGRRLEKKKTG